MFVTSLIASLVLIQAPSDVPKEHWAFPAVNALFREGLLKGYPSGRVPALELKDSVRHDLNQAEKWIREWTKKKLFDNSFGSCWLITSSPPSPYESAVAVHMTLENADATLKDPNISVERRMSVRKELPRIAMAISMFEPELVKLGADVPRMMRQLNDLNDSPSRLFHGDKR